MDYQKWILEQLIFKYEHSGSFAVEVPVRKITIDLNMDNLLEAALRDPREEQKFMKALEALRDAEMIGYVWSLREDGIWDKRIWLLPSERGIRMCYEALDREYKKDIIRHLKDMLVEWGQETETKTPMSRFIEEMQSCLMEQHKIPRFFVEDSSLNAHIIRCMIFMEKNEEEVLERQLSLELYENRTYYEKEIRKRVLSIFKYVKRKENEEVPEDAVLLQEKGVTRWPEIMEFCGKIKVMFQFAEEIDYEKHRLGVYIDSDMVKSIRQIFMESIKRVLIIENKDAYSWYLKHQKKEDELVLLHGRCLSPMKRKWFEKIYSAGKMHGNSIRFFHWGDVDVEGIRIFAELKNNVIPDLEFYKMDVSFLLEEEKRGKNLPTLSYFRKLREMRKDSAYAHFWNVIDEMLRRNVMLKQEDLLY